MTVEARMETWVEGFAADWVRANPLLATRAQYFKGAEQAQLDSRLTLAHAYGGAIGRRAVEERAALARRGLAELRDVEDAAVAGEARTSAAIVRAACEEAVANAPFARQRFVFDSFKGLHVGHVAFLATQHPVRDADDAEHYLARLDELPDCLDGGIEDARDAADHGCIPPRRIVERTLGQLDALAIPPADHPLVTTFVQRLEDVASLTPAQRAGFAERARRAVEQHIVPAFGRVHAMMTEHGARAREEAGAWTLPDGAAYYGRSLETEAATTMSPAEVHALGREEVARISAEMDAILVELGYRDGDLNARVRRLNADLQQPADPAAMLAELNALVADARRRAEPAFNVMPKAPCVVLREPAFSESSAAAHYVTPAPDGSSPGVYYVPMPSLDPNLPWFGTQLKTTAYHEAIPGHHFQLAIEQENRALPHFRRAGAFGYLPSFGEGWALYAEHLCAENGWYDGDLPGRLGYLGAQLFRARRLVVDTGLHAMRWTPDEAIAYGFPESEIDRYIVWPGQACSYYLGFRRILAMRERTRETVGARFDVKAFHDVVLLGGAMPLDVLEQRVAASIAS